ncbi:uncharacterized protein LOC105212066 [Zeugodacus cucurbitae]|uniref:uncharacterized protein LOC105212066 n=1 Tax=Zeugodacus cucurbitae TaxID=28588 RepID=UPI0023D940DC|nr:uncharacterized protein LOC105212066 [Zeugodacus cucurbitae]
MSGLRQVRGLLVVSLALELAKTDLLAGAEVTLESLPNVGVAKIKIPVLESPHPTQEYSETTLPLPVVIQLPQTKHNASPRSTTPQAQLNDAPDDGVQIIQQKDEKTGAENIHIIHATQTALRKQLEHSDKPPQDFVPVFKMHTNEQNADGTHEVTIYVW